MTPGNMRACVLRRALTPQPNARSAFIRIGRMIVIETFQRGSTPRYRPTAPTAAIRIDTS